MDPTSALAHTDTALEYALPPPAELPLEQSGKYLGFLNNAVDIDRLHRRWRDRGVRAMPSPFLGEAITGEPVDPNRFDSFDDYTGSITEAATAEWLSANSRYYRERFDNLLKAATNTHDMLVVTRVFLWLREQDGDKLPREKDLIRNIVQRCATIVSDDEGCANPNTVANTMYPVVEYLAQYKMANKPEGAADNTVRNRMKDLLTASDEGTAEREAMDLMWLQFINGTQYQSSREKCVTEQRLKEIRQGLKPVSGRNPEKGFDLGIHGLLNVHTLAERTLDYLASDGRTRPEGEDPTVESNAKSIRNVTINMRSRIAGNPNRELPIDSTQKIANLTATSSNRSLGTNLPTSHDSIMQSMATLIRAIDPVGYDEAFRDLDPANHEKHKLYRAVLEYMRHAEAYAIVTR